MRARTIPRSGRPPTYRWQELQLSPGLKCLSVGPWQETQFIAAVCQAGFGGDVGWPAASLWQTAQLPLAWTGT